MDQREMVFSGLKDAFESRNATFVIQCMEDDRKKDINWITMLLNAYERGLTDLVDHIQKSTVVTLHDKLFLACYSGDIEFVSKCIANNVDIGQGIQWMWLFDVARTSKHDDIVRCITDSKRIDSMFYGYMYSILAKVPSILEYITQLICTSKGPDVNKHRWVELVKPLFDSGNTELLRLMVTEKHVDDWDMILACIDGNLAFVQDWLQSEKHQHNRHSLTAPGGSWFVTICSILAYNEGHNDLTNIIIAHGSITILAMDLIINQGIHSNAVKYISSRLSFPVRAGASVIPLHALCNLGGMNITPNPQSQEGVIKAAVKLLMEAGMDINAVGHNGQTPLHMVCQGENDDIENIRTNFASIEVEERLQGKDKLLKQIRFQQNFETDRQDLIRFLIEHKADVNALDFNGQNPLHLACASGVNTRVDILLDAGARIDNLGESGMSPIAICSMHGHTETMKVLLKRQCNIHLVNQYGQSPLYNACQWNKEKAAKLLIDNSALINEADCDGVTPVCIASWKGYTDIVSLLLENGADANIIDNEGQTPLHKVAIAGYTETAKILLKYDSSIDTKDITGCTPFHLSCQNHIDMVNMLIQFGSLMHTSNNLGNTALHMSVLSKKMPIVKILWSNSADINQRTNMGETPLACAISTLDMDMFYLLMGNNADVNTVDNLGRGVLHTVVSCRLFADTPSPVDKDVNTMISELLLRGLSINSPDYNKQAPLHLAAASGNMKATRVILDHKADISTKDKFDHLPLMLAVPYPKLFRHLWEKHLTSKIYKLKDCHVEELARLAHWYHVPAVLEICQPMLKQSSDFSGCVQELKSLNCNINQSQLMAWLNKDKNSLQEAHSDWLPSLQAKTYAAHPHINQCITNFVQDLAVQVEKVDDLVAFICHWCGSNNEKTKVFAMDEQDCTCLLKKIKFDMFQTPTRNGGPGLEAFVELVCKDEYIEQLQSLLDKENRLAPGKLFQHFSQAVSEVLAKRELWNKYPNIQRVTVQDITAGNRKITALNIKWHDTIYPLLDISIDLCPSIAIPNWLPPWSNKHNLLQKVDCIALPKAKSSGYTHNTMMEIGVGKWGTIFDEMPEEMRQGYRLAKVARDKAVCPQIGYWPEVHAGDFITSYMLKQCIIKEYASIVSDSRKKDILDAVRALYTIGANKMTNLDVSWARRIYEMMQEAFETQRLESFFIPNYNLLHDDKYAQYRKIAISYARLCRRLLTPQSAQHFRKAYMGVIE